MNQPHPLSAAFSQRFLRLPYTYNISPRFRHWSSMVDDKRARVRRALEDTDSAAGRTLLLLPLGMIMSIRGGLNKSLVSCYTGMH